MAQLGALGYGGTPVSWMGGTPQVGVDASYWQQSGKSNPPKYPQSDEGRLARAIAKALGNRDFDIDFFAYLLTSAEGPDTNVDLFRVVLALFRQWAEALDTGAYYSDDERTVYEMARKVVKTMQAPENTDDDDTVVMVTPNPNDILD